MSHSALWRKMLHRPGEIVENLELEKDMDSGVAEKALESHFDEIQRRSGVFPRGWSAEWSVPGIGRRAL